jgi:hypothetical protein
MRSTVSMLLGALVLCSCVGRSDDFDLGQVERGGKFDCTHTIGYWKTHSAFETKKSLHHPWPISESTLLCGETWYDLLHTEPEGDPVTILAHQWIGAALNWGSGAPMPAEIEALIAEGNWYLNDCAIDEYYDERMIEVSEALDAYNNGLAGVAHCE